MVVTGGGGRLEQFVIRERVAHRYQVLSCIIQPTLALVKEYLPRGAKINRVSGTHWSCVDSSKERRILGFKLQHVWQNYLKDR